MSQRFRLLLQVLLVVASFLLIHCTAWILGLQRSPRTAENLDGYHRMDSLLALRVVWEFAKVWKFRQQ
jgi:hypothetical protein